MLDLDVVGVRVEMPSNNPIVLLRERVSGRYLPIWVGASGEQRSLPLVARYADAWHAFGDLDTLGPKSQRLSAMCDDAGRDPATLLRSASLSIEGSVDDARAQIDAWRDAGFGYLIVGWPSGGRAQVEEFARAVL